MASVSQQVPAPVVSSEQMTALQHGVAGFGREQLIWSSGFLAGLANVAPQQQVTLAAVPAMAQAGIEWTVFYATETGNSRELAENLAAQARGAGISANIQDLAEYKPRGLAKLGHALFVLPTHGIGDAPEGSEAFFAYWFAENAPRLDSLSYSILALGDSSYADFCEIGRAFDARLQELGASPVIERVDCDLDFAVPAGGWAKSFVDYAKDRGTVIELPAAASARALNAVSDFSRANPFEAAILSRQVITGAHSSKQVIHIELDLEGSGLRYSPGDSLAVRPQNPAAVVFNLLDAVGFSADETVFFDGSTIEIGQALTTGKDITLLSRPVLDRVAADRPDVQNILGNRDRLAEFLRTRQLIDLVSDYPVDWTPQDLVDKLRNLSPRSYSIASSPDANPDEAHLTVAVVDYDAFGRHHIGAASNYLAGDVGTVPVYIESNPNFRLPEDADTPIIMIGAGTGIAPYRAFLEHRREHGHGGGNWLIFGERSFANDFLYQIELLRYRKEGVLNRLDVAFSRDQKNKIYVQQRIVENGARMYDWLQNGAQIYVCGDAYAMASDVHDAIRAVVQRYGSVSTESADDFLNELKRAGRYQRDVY